MHDHVTIYKLPEYWQEKIRHLRAENRNLRYRLKLASVPGGWKRKVQKLVSENRGLRSRLRAAEHRIAELEAVHDA